MKRLLVVVLCAVLLLAAIFWVRKSDHAGAIGETTTSVRTADMIPDLPPEINTAASATSPAVRLDPPTTPEPTTTPPPPSWSTESRNGHCVGFEGLLAQYSPGWSVSRMSGIMYRESRCQPGASNACCSGLLQIHRMHIPIEECNVWSRSDFYNPVKNICAAAWLWRIQGYGGWSTS